MGHGLFTNPVGWLILLFAGAIAGTIALVNHFTVSLEEQQKITADLQNKKRSMMKLHPYLNSMMNLKQLIVEWMKLNNKDSLTLKKG